MKHEQLISEARAKITWGEPASSVRLFLIENGLSQIEADVKIKELSLERNQEIRSRGITNISIGTIIAIGAGFIIYLCWKSPSFNRGSGSFLVLVGIILVGIYGIWKLLNGIISLLWPQSEKDSISDFSD